MAQIAPALLQKEAVMTTKVAFLISGGGSLMGYALEEGVPAALVIADRPCPGLDIAKQRGIPTVILDKDAYGVKPGVFDDNRDQFSHVVADTLNAHNIDLVSMAGWETILTTPYFQTFRGWRTINNDPAILPAFKGRQHAVQDAFDAGVLITGYTIHVATEEVDDGEYLEQEAVRVLPDDTVDSLHERIKELERPGLVRVLRKLMRLQRQQYIQSAEEQGPFRRHSDAPFCYQCGIQMQRAGTCHACPSCGATSGCS